MPEANGVADLVLEHAREAERLCELRTEVGGILKDHVAAIEGIERDPSDRAAGADRRRAAANRERQAGHLIVRVLERDDAVAVRNARPRPLGDGLRRRPGVLQRDEGRRGTGPRGERRLDLGDRIARDWRRRGRVLVPGNGRAGVGLGPAPSSLEQPERCVRRLQFRRGRSGAADRWPADHGRGQTSKLVEGPLGSRRSAAHDHGVARAARQARVTDSTRRHIELGKAHGDAAPAVRSALEAHQDFAADRVGHAATDILRLVADDPAELPDLERLAGLPGEVFQHLERAHGVNRLTVRSTPRHPLRHDTRVHDALREPDELRVSAVENGGGKERLRDRERKRQPDRDVTPVDTNHAVAYLGLSAGRIWTRTGTLRRSPSHAVRTKTSSWVPPNAAPGCQ